MTISRAIQIDLNSTQYYHCISRCVRRAFLCGKDASTGQDFNHRKKWLINRIKYLASVFCMQICAYAIMSNHYHLVLFVDSDKAISLTNEDVFEKWETLCPQDASKYKDFDNSSTLLQEKLSEWRKRLTSISWFMKFINEHIAKLANKEDNCTGRFWESRFKSQALLDETAILSAMAYVDLNPIRAGIAKTPETSTFTSIYERIKYFTKQNKENNLVSNVAEDSNRLQNCDMKAQPPKLMPFANSENHQANVPHIHFNLSDYLLLVDLSGRNFQDDKRGKIPDTCLNILTRLNLSTDGWFEIVKGLESQFFLSVGDPILISAFGATHRKSSPKGLLNARRIYRAA